jgi:large subunit ribosomal protein L21
MKKAVIATGGKQYVVGEGETVEVELLNSDKTKVSFDALLVIDGQKVTVGAPSVKDITVTAEIVEPDVQQDKVTSIRYKAKKRVHTVRGHRQRLTTLKIKTIA